MASTSGRHPINCWICGRAVALESCMIDEHGMAVHEDCSVGEIAARAKASTPRTNRPTNLEQHPSSN